ncbi:MAG: carbamoyltransferase N-terminal domain-containing protein [Paracoccaceae bacterium]|nr:carbamoyltransferase N-terminal domain-containing protein [Paracoccaceae bacterium]
MQVLGISAFYHDSACCLLRDGKLVAAIEQEKLSRLKHDKSFPDLALRFCLDAGRTSIEAIDAIAYYERPDLKLERQLSMALQPEASESMRYAISQNLDPDRVEAEIRTVTGFEGPVLFFGHHLSHAASAFFFSPFDSAAILTCDGVGEWATTTFGYGDEAGINLMAEIEFPDSIGLLYSTLTSFLGFSVNDGESRVMGLAPYGRPTFVDALKHLYRAGRGLSFRLDRRYFDYLEGERMFSQSLTDHLGIPPRKREAAISQEYKDLARSLQIVLEEILLEKIRYLHDRTQSDSLCMAGGVALNCVANARIRRDGPFKRLFVQPAPGDSGGALGAAALAYSSMSKGQKIKTPLSDVYLGPSWNSEEIASLLEGSGATVADYRGREEALCREAAQRLSKGEAAGWFFGAAEFGPRALGNRSILADARRPDMRDHINSVVKKREAFRPFAPVVAESEASEIFEIDVSLPFMLETCQAHDPDSYPAITHVDGSARVQTVNAKQNPRLCRLLDHFKRETGVPILLNTSFNIKGEPIVCSPLDAIICFIRSNLDFVVLQDFLIERSGIPPHWMHICSTPLNCGAKAVSDDIYAMF